MSTIKDVARLAGVAVGTVSHVISGSVPVSPQLRAKVESAIRKLDYHPNHVARSLKTSRTRTLGIVVPDMTISFFPQIIHGAEAAARAQNYSLMAVNSNDSAQRQQELLTLLRSQRMEGILLVTANGSSPADQIGKMIEAGIPVVCLDRIPDKLRIDSVSVDDTAAAELGVAHLIEAGHRRIAIVTGPPTLKNERGRLQGYRNAMRGAGLPVDEELIWHGSLQAVEVTELCRPKLLDRSLRIDAVFSTNGPAGIGVLRAMRELRLRTPEDLAFATFDELAADDLFSPSITTVVQPSYDIGFRAAEILLKRIQNSMNLESAARIRLPATLKVRESSCAHTPRAMHSNGAGLR